MTTPNRLRVLVVDDDEFVLKATLRTLRLHDFQTSGILNPVAALALCKQQKFDVVVSDVVMPRMNGFQMKEAICKEMPEMVGKFVFVSGGGDTPEIQMCLSTVKHLQKPYKNEDLLATIREITG
ncbi:MAG: response regulator [Nitrososphaerales archaeon]